MLANLKSGRGRHRVNAKDLRRNSIFVLKRSMEEPRCSTDLPWGDTGAIGAIDWRLRNALVMGENQPPIGVYNQRGPPFHVSLVKPEIVVQPVMWRMLIQRFGRSARAGASISEVTYLAIAPGTPSLFRARTHQPIWFAEQGHRRTVDPP